VALILGVPIWSAILSGNPQSLNSVRGAATISFQADDDSFVFSNDCVVARWAVEGIQSVQLNEVGVVGLGEQLSCEDQLELEVVFQDGAKEEYLLAKPAVTDHLAGRLLLVSVVVFFGLALFVSGIPARVWQSAARSPAAAMFGRLFPPLPAQGWSLSARRLDLLVMTLLILVGIVARMAFMSLPLKYDEAWSYVDFAAKPLAYGLSTYDTTNNHIFYTLMMSLSVQIFGSELWAIRLPAFFAGVLTIPMAFQVARRFYRDKRAAWLASALVAGVSALIEFSASGRGYSTTTLLFLALLALASDLLRAPSPGRWGALALLSALGLYTVPIMLYPLGVVWGWLLVSLLLEKRGGVLRRMLMGLMLSAVGVVLLTLLFYAPVLLSGSWQQGETTQVIAPMGSAEFMERLEFIIESVWRVWTRDMPAWFWLLLVLGFVASVVLDRRVGRQAVSWFWVSLLWLPFVTFVQHVSTYSRLWVFLLPICLIAAAAGLLYLVRRVFSRSSRAYGRVVAVASVLTALCMAAWVMNSQSIYESTEGGLMNDSETVVRELRDLIGTGDWVMCAGSCATVMYYAERLGVEMGTVWTPIPSDAETVVLIVTTFHAADRNLEPIFEVLPPAFRQYPREQVKLYTHAEVLRFQVQGDLG
jgi:hypothetical protein